MYELTLYSFLSGNYIPSFCNHDSSKIWHSWGWIQTLFTYIQNLQQNMQWETHTSVFLVLIWLICKCFNYIHNYSDFQRICRFYARAHVCVCVLDISFSLFGSSAFYFSLTLIISWAPYVCMSVRLSLCILVLFVFLHFLCAFSLPISLSLSIYEFSLFLLLCILIFLSFLFHWGRVLCFFSFLLCIFLYLEMPSSPSFSLCLCFLNPFHTFTPLLGWLVSSFA